MKKYVLIMISLLGVVHLSNSMDRLIVDGFSINDVIAIERQRAAGDDYNYRFFLLPSAMDSSGVITTMILVEIYVKRGQIESAIRHDWRYHKEWGWDKYDLVKQRTSRQYLELVRDALQNRKFKNKYESHGWEEINDFKSVNP